MMSFRLRLWLEHQGTPETHRLYLNVWQAPLLAPHNSWMHWEHHSWPTIPYHRLAEVRKHDAEPPVWTLAELFKWFKQADHIPSGQAFDAMCPCDHHSIESGSRDPLVIVV